MSSGSRVRGRRHGWALLGALLLVCLAVAYLGSLVTVEQVRVWYPTLAKPVWTPPNWLFGPMWTTLYVLMAVAGWRVMRDDGVVRGRAARLWWVQIALNAAWSPLFFGAHLIAVAAVVIIALWITLALFIRASWRTHRAAAWLFVPYIAWITLASALNLAIWRLN